MRNDAAIKCITEALQAAYRGLALAGSAREKRMWQATIRARQAELKRETQG